MKQQANSTYTGDYYTGPVVNFTLGAGIQFWYLAKPDGTPVE